MTIPEIFGFLITLFILGFLFLKQVWEAREQRADPEKYRKKQLEKERQLKKFMKTMHIDMDDEEEEERRIKAARKQAQKQTQKQQPEKRQTNAAQSQSSIHSSKPSTASFSPAPITRQRLDAINSKKRTLGTVYAATQEQESIASNLVQSQKSLRDAILLNEIIGPPRGR